MYRGSKLLFVSSLMKAWCQSVFLIMCTRTHTEQTLAFSTISCYSRELGSLWQQSSGLVTLGVCSSSHLGLMASASHYVSVFFLLPYTTRVFPVLRCQPLLRPPEQACWLNFPQTVPSSFSHASNITPGVSVPFFHFFSHPLSILVFIGFVS